MPLTDSQLAPLTKPTRRPAPRESVISHRFRAKHGIAPIGDGPHAESAYGLPVPPADHPHARAFARAAIRRATSPQVLERYGKRAVARQVAKANGVLYGTAKPTEVDKANATALARARRAAGFSRESQLGLGVSPIAGETKASASTIASLREAVASDTAPGVARVCLIRSGPGNLADRHWYTDAALKGSRGLFEGAQCFLDHPTRDDERNQPERSVRSLAGYFDNVAFEDVDDALRGTVKGLTADFHPEIGNVEVLSKLRTAAKYAEAHPTTAYIGFSINALGGGTDATIDGEEWSRVDVISQVGSVDIVTAAGAGGKLLSFKESRRMSVRVLPNRSGRFDTPEKKLAEANRLAKAARKQMRESGDGLRIGIDELKLSTAFKALLAEKQTALTDALKAKLKEADGAALTPDVIDAMCKNLGIDPDGSLGALLDQAAGVQDGDEAEMDDDASEGGDPMGDDDDDQDADPKKMGEVDKMTTEQLRVALKAERAAAAVVTTEAAKAKRESAANAAKADSAAKALRESDAAAVLDELKIPETFRPRLRSELLERNLGRKAMLAHAQAFASSFITPMLESGGNAGNSAAGFQKITTAPRCLAD